MILMIEQSLPMLHAGMTADEKLQQDYYEKGKIFRLQLESTLKCSQLCNYCYANSKPESFHGLSSSKIREILKSANMMGVKIIDWLGGDPILRPDWYELCKFAQELGLINNIWTSGIPLANLETAKKVVECTDRGFISVHLDSLRPKLYSQVHGNMNRKIDVKNIELILQGIHNCLKLGKHPKSLVNCITLTRPLADGDAKNTIHFFNSQFGIKTCLTLYKPVTRISFYREWQPTKEQIIEIYKFRDALYPEDKSVGAMDVSKFYCGTKVCVTAYGWIVPCSVIRTEEFGNINNFSFNHLIELHKHRLLFLDFRDTKKMPGKCKNCNSNTICFGCRSNAFYYKGDISAEDPMCQSFRPSD